MLDVAWPELIVIGAVALVVIGPKDLPKVMNTMGQWVGKARRAFFDMQRGLEQLNVEAEAVKRAEAAKAEELTSKEPLHDQPPPVMTPHNDDRV